MSLASEFSLKTRIAAAFAILVIGTALLLTLFTNHVASVQVKDDVGRFLAEVAFQTTDKLDREMWSRAREVEILGQLDAFQDTTHVRQMQDIIEKLQTAIPIFSWIGFTDPEGTVIAATGNILLGKSLSQRPVYREGLKGLFVGDVHDAVLLANLLPNPTGEAMKFVDISTPVYGPDNKLRGVLATHLSWEWVGEIDTSYIKPLFEKEHVDVFVVSTDNVIVLGPKDMLGKRLDLPILDRVRKGAPAYDIQRWPDGQDYLTGAAFGDGHLTYAGLGWTAIARQRTADAYVPVARTRNLILGLGLFFSLAAAFVGVGLAGKITRPLGRIVRSAQALRDGQLSEFPVYKGIPEIEILSSSLREMIESLSRTRAERDDMRHLAHVDALTQLPNRTQFEAHVAKLQTAALPRDMVLSVFFLDLDGFKNVNDTLGHEAGDFVLQTVAVRLAGCLRSADLLARLGGDEFVALVPLDKSLAVEEARQIGSRIIESVNNEIFIGKDEVHVGCSIGVAFYHGGGQPLENVLRCADMALYQAKEHGKNILEFDKDCS